jgi:nicotinate-nucleotide pyrophosphorylase (carboxylating)
LLDNMDESQLRAAVAQVGGRAQLEASGGVTLQTLRALAQTGIEWISMGALTHSAPALDLSLIMEAQP